MTEEKKNEVKKQVHEVASKGASKAATAAKRATGWKKWLLTALAVLLAGLAVFTQVQCTTSYTQSAGGDIQFTGTIILPVEESKK